MASVDQWLWHDGWDGRRTDGWAGGQTDRQAAGSRQEVTAWLGEAVLEVTDGAQRALREAGQTGEEGRSVDRWTGRQTDEGDR